MNAQAHHEARVAKHRKRTWAAGSRLLSTDAATGGAAGQSSPALFSLRHPCPRPEEPARQNEFEAKRR